VKALVLSIFANGEPLDLPLTDENGPVIAARTLVARADDVAVYLVSGTSEQIAVLPKRQGIYTVGPGDWDTAIDAATATIVNKLLADGGYEPLPEGTSYLDGMRAVRGQEFDGALYDCMAVEDGVPMMDEDERTWPSRMT